MAGVIQRAIAAIRQRVAERSRLQDPSPRVPMLTQRGDDRGSRLQDFRQLVRRG